jgi:hypothetical protein
MLAREAKTNPKAVWAYMKNQAKGKEGIPDLISDKDNQTTVSTDIGKAELLNNFFSSVFTREDLTNIPDPQVRDFGIPLENVTINMERVEKKLKNLKSFKSGGPDKMHPGILKELVDCVKTPLTIIFKKSVDTNKIPEEWKRANIAPIFKKGSKKQTGNYRPVSLTSVVCKMLEGIVRDEIMKHLDENGLISNNQYGFRNKRSTCLQLLKVLDDWTEMLDEGLPFDVVYLDFKKAFDTVPHQRLIRKLKAYGIKQPLVLWIEDFLSSRTQRVSINGTFSGWKEVLSGIPQGSVLGPLLFVIYINDLPDVVESFNALFADDTKIYAPVKYEEQANILQQGLEKLDEWSNKWQLKFNVSKCKVVHFGKANTKHEYSMEDGETTKPLPKDIEEKDLGVLFDENLKFSKHIAAVSNKATKILGMVRRSFKYMDGSMLTLVYKALIRPHLEYANSVWCPILKKDRDKLENVQRRATKLVPELKEMPYESRLRTLEIPTLVFRRLRGDMIQTFKILKGIYNISPDTFFTLETSTRTRGHSLKLRLPRTRTKNRQHYFSVRVTSHWNELPQETIDADTVNAFKNRLDRFWANHPAKYDFRAEF